MLVIKFAGGDGDLEWMKIFGGAAGGDDVAWSIVVGDDGDPVVTGMFANADGSANFYTRKLASSNGATVWERELPGAVNNITEAGWLAVMDNDDIVMCNRTWTSTTSYDVVLHRYAASNGATVWDIQHGSGGTNADDPRHMIRDADGNLLVAGVTSGDYMVLEFDHTDGEVIWSATYDGPPGWYDVANCVAIGPHGNVIATGFSDGTGTGWDLATLALDADTGDELWVRRYDAGDDQSDEGFAMAASTQGDLYVAGYGYRWASGNDMLAVRYHIDTSSAAGDTPAVLASLSAYPNPFNPRVTFGFSVPQNGPARLAIYDARGRLVTVLRDEIVNAGRHSASWDGRDARGLPVPGGLYLARIEGPGVSVGKKIVLAK